MKKLLFASLCLAVGLASSPAMAADSAADATASAANRFWVGAEYLRWTVKGDKLPALVTTSPPGTPTAEGGVLGFPGTAVLFGDSTVNDEWRSGGLLGYRFLRATDRLTISTDQENTIVDLPAFTIAATD